MPILQKRNYISKERVNMNEKAKMKDRDEVNLIADYEMEWGQEDHWSDDVIAEFDKKWEIIQRKYK